jgi:hypothetical protein
MLMKKGHNLKLINNKYYLKTAVSILFFNEIFVFDALSPKKQIKKFFGSKNIDFFTIDLFIDFSRC